MTASSMTSSHGLSLSALASPFKSIAKFFEAVRRAQAATQDFERLNSMTDASLAQRGLHRADISRAVMERHYS